MKKILLAMVIIFSLSSFTFALGGVGIFADFTTVSMGKINDQITSISTGMSVPGFTPTVAKFGSGILVGISATGSLLPVLDLGIRVGYLYAFPASVKLSVSGGGFNMDENATMNASLIPIEIGLAYNLALPMSPLSLGLGAYVGYGMASLSMENKMTTNVPGIPNVDDTVPMSGGCVVVDIIANGSFSIAPMMTLGLDLGYRIANVSQVKATKDVPDFGVKNGDVMKDANGNAIPVDFSGLLVGLKFAIGF